MNVIAATSDGCINVYNLFFEHTGPRLVLQRRLRVADSSIVITSFAIQTRGPRSDDHRLVITDTTGGVNVIFRRGKLTGDQVMGREPMKTVKLALLPIKHFEE